MASKTSATKTSTWAILALVFGILIAPLGIVFGIIALNEIHNNKGIRGKGLAIAGIVLGGLGILIFTLIITFALYFISNLIVNAPLA
ncbi:MAG: DUF4190 domain-containing protein [Nanoarchaeota archaeon]